MLSAARPPLQVMAWVEDTRPRVEATLAHSHHCPEHSMHKDTKAVCPAEPWPHTQDSDPSPSTNRASTGMVTLAKQMPVATHLAPKWMP